jgi:ParB family transcriptional regulator, chromosome partitioning protein
MKRQSQIREFMALDKLAQSPRNARKVPHSQAYIESLAANILVLGQTQNSIVEPELRDGKATGRYLVTAGEARRLAQLLLVKRKKIPKNNPVPCVIDTEHDACELSTSENAFHEPMHPADEFEAFRAMVDNGKSLEDIAARFGLQPIVVQRRLRLANVHPQFIELYRKDEVSLEQLMALALTDDHTQQVEVWSALGPHDRQPHALRRLLMQNETSARSAIARFVGIKNYEKAGGAVRRDLFSERDDEYLIDTALLMRLANERLQAHAAKLKKKEGYAWIEVMPHIDYSTLSTYGRVAYQPRQLTKDEEATLDVLETQRAAIANEAENANEDEARLTLLDQRAEEIDNEIAKLQERQSTADPEQAAVAGAIVTIDSDGHVRVERDLLKPDDKKRFAASLKDHGKSPGATERAETPRNHSAALVRKLTAHRTLALQAMLTQRPNVALVALVHGLAVQVLYCDPYRSALKVSAFHAQVVKHGDDLKGCKASCVLAEERCALQALLPQSPGDLFGWLLTQPVETVHRVMAFCVATTLDVVRSAEDENPGDELARATELDMRQWWTPTADGYLRAIPKKSIEAALREADATGAAMQVASLKKDAAAKLAEEHLVKMRWLPALLRAPVAA